MKTGAIKNICVFGIGGVGGVTAARIGRALAAVPATDDGRSSGRTLSVVARGPHLEAIRRDGLLLEEPSGAARTVTPDYAADRPEDLPAPDLVFLCVKGYSLADAASALAGTAGPGTVIIPLLNGADIYDRLRARLDTPIILPACIYVSARIERPGVVRHIGGGGTIHFGPDPMRPEYDPAELLTLMNSAEIPYRWYADPAPAIWTKYLFIAAFGLVTAARDISFGPLLDDPESVARLRNVMNEICRIAEAKGISLPPDIIEETFRTARTFPPETKTSFQRDVESGAERTEGDLFGGTILRLGRELGIDTPVTAELYAAIIKIGT